MITKSQMDSMARAIELRYQSLNTPVRCTSVGQYPSAGVLEFYIQPYGTNGKFANVAKILSLRDDIGNALQNRDIRIFLNPKNEIIIEVLYDTPQPVTIDKLASSRAPKHSLVLGRSKSGVPLLFDLKDPVCAHLLISGSTGSGKTALAHSILITASIMHAPDDLHFVIIDPKNSTPWLDDRLEGHLIARPESIEGAAEILNKIAQNMFSKRSTDKIVVFIDELADICVESQVAKSAIEVLVQQGRKYGVHVIACTQKPTASVLGSLMKSNMRRIVGKVMSVEDARVASGVSKCGAEHIQSIGTFIFVDGELTRFDA
jgi:DNA segregation ATPase FtsK/SpoIIIE, S-DNA-T family